jgi:hypothetical protein
MADGAEDLQHSSRVYYGIHHPVQYNVKVKDIGQVLAHHIPALIGNWKEEDDVDGHGHTNVTSQPAAQSITEDAIDSDGNSDDDMQEAGYQHEATGAEYMDVSSANGFMGPLSSSKIL